MNAKAIELNVGSILEDGEYFILNDFSFKKEMYAKAKKTFFKGIEKYEGSKCRKAVERDGLSKLHLHFPVEKILLLEQYLSQELRNDLYYWTYKIGKDNLRLQNDFYVDYLIMMRVHYPFEVAKKAKKIVQPPFPLKDKLGLIKAALKNPALISNAIQNILNKEEHSYDPKKYHKNLPYPARSHGPHMDTWYGHSFDGINFWWSIDGVNEDNTVILYPELFKYKIPFDPTSMYVAKDVPLPAPIKVKLNPGDLLIFNPEMLHGTQVNISDETRIVISTRLNPGIPAFEKQAGWHFEHWFASSDLEQKEFSKIRVFPSKKNRGEPAFKYKDGHPIGKTIILKIDQDLNTGKEIPVCQSNELSIGQKIAIDFNNAKLILIKNKKGVAVFNRICPHLGLDIKDGHHDEDHLFCPGHGVAFSCSEGSSTCDLFKLEKYHVVEKEGQIFIMG